MRPTGPRERAMMIRISLVASLAALTVAVAAQAYEAGPVTGGATVSGKIVYNGAVPTRKIIPTKDLEVCGGIRDEPLIELGADKGVQNAVVYLADAGKGKAWSAAPKPPEVDNLKCR